MTMTHPGKIELQDPRSQALRDLSDPEVRKQILTEAQNDAKKSVTRARRFKRSKQAR